VRRRAALPKNLLAKVGAKMKRQWASLRCSKKDYRTCTCSIS
jgi:hypothetical protein